MTRGAGSGRELDAGDADPAGGAVHHRVLARAEAALGEERIVGGREHLGEAARLRPS